MKQNSKRGSTPRSSATQNSYTELICAPCTHHRQVFLNNTWVQVKVIMETLLNSVWVKTKSYTYLCSCVLILVQKCSYIHSFPRVVVKWTLLLAFWTTFAFGFWFLNCQTQNLSVPCPNHTSLLTGTISHSYQSLNTGSLISKFAYASTPSWFSANAGTHLTSEAPICCLSSHSSQLISPLLLIQMSCSSGHHHLHVLCSGRSLKVSKYLMKLNLLPFAHVIRGCECYRTTRIILTDENWAMCNKGPTAFKGKRNLDAAQLITWEQHWGSNLLSGKKDHLQSWGEQPLRKCLAYHHQL